MEAAEVSAQSLFLLDKVQIRLTALENQGGPEPRVSIGQKIDTGSAGTVFCLEESIPSFQRESSVATFSGRDRVPTEDRPALMGASTLRPTPNDPPVFSFEASERVVKVFKLFEAEAPDKQIARIRQEANYTAQVNNEPVHLYIPEAGDDHSEAYLIIPRKRGKTLFNYLREIAHWSDYNKFKLLTALFEKIKWLHEDKGLIHGDLHLANIFIDDSDDKITFNERGIVEIQSGAITFIDFGDTYKNSSEAKATLPLRERDKPLRRTPDRRLANRTPPGAHSHQDLYTVAWDLLWDESIKQFRETKQPGLMSRLLRTITTTPRQNGLFTERANRWENHLTTQDVLNDLAVLRLKTYFSPDSEAALNIASLTDFSDLRHYVTHEEWRPHEDFSEIEFTDKQLEQVLEYYREQAFPAQLKQLLTAENISFSLRDLISNLRQNNLWLDTAFRNNCMTRQDFSRQMAGLIREKLKKELSQLQGFGFAYDHYWSALENSINKNDFEQVRNLYLQFSQTRIFCEAFLDYQRNRSQPDAAYRDFVYGNIGQHRFVNLCQLAASKVGWLSGRLHKDSFFMCVMRRARAHPLGEVILGDFLQAGTRKIYDRGFPEQTEGAGIRFFQSSQSRQDRDALLQHVMQYANKDYEADKDHEAEERARFIA